MRRIMLVLLVLAAAMTSGCRSQQCAPETKWPPHDRWIMLDPVFCHPYPCSAGHAEWPGILDNR